MEKKVDLLFALSYFGCLFLGFIANFFDPLFDNIYYGHLEYLFNRIVRIVIYLILAITLGAIYKLKSNEPKENTEEKEFPLKKKIVLYIVTLSFITLISIIAGWQLKPLSDLGEKYTFIQIYNKLSDLGVLAMEIYFMIASFKHFDNFYSNNFKSPKNFSVAIIFVLLTHSIYSLITNFTIYQLVFIPFTILLGFIYPYTKKNFWITYLVAVLVFLF